MRGAKQSMLRGEVAVVAVVGLCVAVIMLCGVTGVGQALDRAHPATLMAQQAEEHAPNHDHASSGGVAIDHDSVVGGVVRDPGLKRGLALVWTSVDELDTAYAGVAVTHAARAPPGSPWGRQLLLTVCIDRR